MTAEQFKEIERFFNLTGSMTETQKSTLKFLNDGGDAYVSIKTGGGKSLCFQAFPLLQPNKLVLVVTPLVSIMKEQTAHLNSLGISSIYIGDPALDKRKLKRGGYKIIFGPPESVVGEMEWRKVWTDMKDHFGLVAVDEAHTIIQWGHSETDKPFREWFNSIGELRSLLPCPFLALTATAGPVNKRKIMESLCMSDALEITELPDRANIKYSTAKLSRNTPLQEVFGWLLDHITQHGIEADRHVIFCKTVTDCAKVYNSLTQCLASNLKKHIQMFHSSTVEEVKNTILEDMSVDGNIRILVCTNSAGMGVNFHQLHNIIHYGPPQDIDSFLQQIGRAGRDGKQAQHLLVYHGSQLRNVDSGMILYVKNSTQCRRACLLEVYEAHSSKDFVPTGACHTCCDICEVTCECAENGCPLIHPYSMYVTKFELAAEEEERLQVRHVNDTDRKCVEHLLHTLLSQHTVTSNFLFKLPVPEELITQISSQLEFITNADDVINCSFVPSYKLAQDIMCVIESVLDVVASDSECEYVQSDD